MARADGLAARPVARKGTHPRGRTGRAAQAAPSGGHVSNTLQSGLPTAGRPGGRSGKAHGISRGPPGTATPRRSRACCRTKPAPTASPRWPSGARCPSAAPARRVRPPRREQRCHALFSRRTRTCPAPRCAYLPNSWPGIGANPRVWRKPRIVIRARTAADAKTARIPKPGCGPVYMLAAGARKPVIYSGVKKSLQSVLRGGFLRRPC